MSNARDILALFELASTSLSEALPQLWEALELAKRDGNTTRAHAISDGLVSLLIHHAVELDKAERLAVELVNSMPDKFHLDLLARVLALRGDTDRRIDTEKRVSAAPDKHDSQRLRQIRERVYKRYVKS